MISNAALNNIQYAVEKRHNSKSKQKIKNCLEMERGIYGPKNCQTQIF